MPTHPVVSRQEWIAARKELLAKEKQLTRQRDELTRQRRDLPWVKVEKQYTFEGPQGARSLNELFAGRSQLIVYHFMYGPDWKEGCPSCSFWADNFEGIPVHLAHRDATLVAVSRAPYQKLAAYRRRMGWTFPWYSSHGSDFNFDFQVSYTPEQVESGGAEHNYTHMKVIEELPGISVFYRGAGDDVYHTYSTYQRGLDMLNGAYHYMDLLPKGRDEEGLPWTMAWLRRHDQYDDDRALAS
jgi:predicted dithiol-disulfide oxidoreductase (DUF899 family)